MLDRYTPDLESFNPAGIMSVSSTPATKESPVSTPTSTTPAIGATTMLALSALTSNSSGASTQTETIAEKRDSFIKSWYCDRRWTDISPAKDWPQNSFQIFILIDENRQLTGNFDIQIKRNGEVLGQAWEKDRLEQARAELQGLFLDVQKWDLSSNNFNNKGMKPEEFSNMPPNSFVILRLLTPFGVYSPTGNNSVIVFKTRVLLIEGG